MPLTGEAKREYNQRYHAARKASQQAARPVCPRPREERVIRGLVSGQTVASALRDAGFNPRSSSLRERLKPGGDLRERLDAELRRAGLTIPKAFKVLDAQLDATRLVKVGDEATTAPDNDARLRAVENVIRLHERAGTIPAASSAGPGGLSLTLVEVHYGQASPQDVVVESIEPVAPLPEIK